MLYYRILSCTEAMEHLRCSYLYDEREDVYTKTMKKIEQFNNYLSLEIFPSHPKNGTVELFELDVGQNYLHLMYISTSPMFNTADNSDNVLEQNLIIFL